MARRKQRQRGTGSVFRRKENGRWGGKYKQDKPVYGSTYDEACHGDLFSWTCFGVAGLNTSCEAVTGSRGWDMIATER